jgi:hypothetical protein
MNANKYIKSRNEIYYTEVMAGILSILISIIYLAFIAYTIYYFLILNKHQKDAIEFIVGAIFLIF